MSGCLGIVPAGIAVIGVTYGLARFAYGLFLPAIQDELALSPSLSGLVGGGAYAGYCVAVVASVWFTERAGPRAAAALAGLVAAFGLAGIALAASPTMLAIAVLIAGMSTGLASPPLTAAVAAAVAPALQARANSLINSGTSIGVALSGPVALVASNSWRAAYWLFAGVAVAVTWWSWRVLPARGTAPATASSAATASLIRAPHALRLVLAALGIGAASAIFWTFALTTLTDVGRLPAAAASLAWIAIGLAGGAGAVGGDLVGRVGAGAVHGGSLLALATALLAVGLAPGSLAVALAAATLFGVAYVMLTKLLLLRGVAVFTDRPAVGLGLPFLALALGQFAGAAAAGTAIGTLGHTTAFILFAGLALTALAAGPAAGEGSRIAPASRRP